jgi:hypothetical protein
MTTQPIQSSTISRVSRLVAWVILIGVIWLVALPWLAARPAMKRHRQWLDDRGIDPGAMYYTELDAMEPILDRLNKHAREHR